VTERGDGPQRRRGGGKELRGKRKLGMKTKIREKPRRAITRKRNRGREEKEEVCVGPCVDVGIIMDACDICA
jgi:hypothetical protein